MQDLTRDIVTAGAAVRRPVRAMLDALGMTYTEHKGWVKSSFVVEGTDEQWDALLDWSEDVQERIAARRAAQ